MIAKSNKVSGALVRLDILQDRWNTALGNSHYRKFVSASEM